MEEKIAKLTVLFILMAIVSWGVALYFFVAHLTSWQVRYLLEMHQNPIYNVCNNLYLYGSNQMH